MEFLWFSLSRREAALSALESVENLRSIVSPAGVRSTTMLERREYIETSERIDMMLSRLVLARSGVVPSGTARAMVKVPAACRASASGFGLYFSLDPKKGAEIDRLSNFGRAVPAGGSRGGNWYSWVVALRWNKGRLRSRHIVEGCGGAGGVKIATELAGWIKWGGIAGEGR